VNSRKPVTDWMTDFDYLVPEWTENPYPIWDELRSKCPIAHTDRFMGTYLATRYEDVRAIANDTEHFSSRRVLVRDSRPPAVPAPPLTSDPPVHRSQRMLLQPAFTAEAVRRYEEQTRSICRELIELLIGKDGCDGAVDYAQEIPTRVTACMLGVEQRDGDQFRKWVHEFLEAGVVDQTVTLRAVREIKVFFETEMQKRRTAPSDDLISYLLSAQIDGQALSEDLIGSILRLILFAGIDTTWSVIGACLWHLATHDEDRRRLAAQPSLIPTAVEEFLRAYAPVMMGREILKETQINGYRLKEGEMVLIPFGAANRDPAKFADADRVIINRSPNPHVAFGLGIHRCLGANLATMEIRVALEEWLGNFQEFTLARDAAVQWSAGPVRGPRRLPLAFGAAAS
jgi:cytochrome P450